MPQSGVWAKKWKLNTTGSFYDEQLDYKIWQTRISNSSLVPKLHVSWYNFIYYKIYQKINKTLLVIQILALQYRFLMHHKDTRL